MFLYIILPHVQKSMKKSISVIVFFLFPSNEENKVAVDYTSSTWCITLFEDNVQCESRNPFLPN